jgi:4-amino-4-deoxy-L-arabinose transferase-like glycosyltransferase
VSLATATLRVDKPEAEQPTGQRKLALGRLSLLGFGALAIRLAYWAIFVPHYVLRSDADQYVTIARNVASGWGIVDAYPQIFNHATAFRPPLYPVLLGELFRVFGPHVAVAQAANAVLGSLVVVLAYQLATRLAGPRAGLVAAVAVALSPSLLANDVVPLSEPLSLVLFLGVILLLLDRRSVVAGLAMGLLVLTRPSAPVLLAVAAIWLLCNVGWRAAFRFVFVASVVVAPWIVRNQIRLHTPVLVTSNGFNVAAMYSPEALSRGGFVDPVFDRQAFGWLRPAQFDEAKWDSLLLRRGIKGAVTHPVDVARIVGQNMVDLTEIRPDRNRGAEVLDGRNLGFRTVTLPFFYLTTILGLLGFWLHRRDSRVRLLFLLSSSVVALSVLTIAAPRLRAPMDLALAIGVGLLAVRPLGKSAPPVELAGGTATTSVLPSSSRRRELVAR